MIFVLAGTLGIGFTEIGAALWSTISNLLVRFGVLSKWTWFAGTVLLKKQLMIETTGADLKSKHCLTLGLSSGRWNSFKPLSLQGVDLDETTCLGRNRFSKIMLSGFENIWWKNSSIWWTIFSMEYRWSTIEIHHKLWCWNWQHSSWYNQSWNQQLLSPSYQEQIDSSNSASFLVWNKEDLNQA